MPSESTGVPLIFSTEETAVLRSALTTMLANLHDEISKTEERALRAQLHQRQALLNGILARLPA